MGDVSAPDRYQTGVPFDLALTTELFTSRTITESCLSDNYMFFILFKKLMSDGLHIKTTTSYP